MGGYCAGPLDDPGIRADKTANTIAAALLHGYVTVSAGVRGRNSVDDRGNYLGAAPAVLCDMKAAVRYLRYNRERIPGNTDRIITNGTSAGGALSALAGATGDHPDYEPYLKQLGAALASDRIQVKMMNPMNYIGDEHALKAMHFRIRHGSVDRDTSLAIPLLLHTRLLNEGIDSNLEFPWGIPHAGDYDLEELFAWIDRIVADGQS